MRFVISSIAIALVTTNAFAAPIRIFYEHEPSRAQEVKRILIGDYQIPEDLIAMKEIPNCDQLSEKGRLDLCLNNNGDLMIVSVDRGFINESLKIFRAP